MKGTTMKNNGCFLLIMFLLIPALLNAKENNPWDRKLPFKRVTIEYTLSGVEKGSETLYIRDYGKETVRYHKTTTTMMGMTMINETITITDPDWVYTFDLNEKSGTKAVNPQKYMIEEYNKLSREEKNQLLKNSEELGTSMSGNSGGEVEKNAEKILGYSCDKMTVMGATVYTIHDTDIALKTESNMMGMAIKMEATKIDKGSVSKKIFQHPKGITPILDSQSDALARAMAKQMMATLKDPEAAQKAADNKPAAQDPKQEDMTPEEQQQLEKAMEALKGIFGS